MIYFVDHFQWWRLLPADGRIEYNNTKKPSANHTFDIYIEIDIAYMYIIQIS